MSKFSLISVVKICYDLNIYINMFIPRKISILNMYIVKKSPKTVFTVSFVSDVECPD